MSRFPHALTLAALAVTAACGSTPATPSAPAVAVETPAASSTPTTPALPSPAPVAHTQTHRADGIEATVTVLRMRRPFPVVVPVDPPQPERKGREFAAAEVKFCLTKYTLPEPLTVSWAPWSIEFRDGTVAEALRSWNSEWWDVPLYPQQHVVRLGRCVRGWVPFEVSKGARAELVTYAPGEGTVLEWEVR